jgi:hypothetical protein
MIATDPGLGVRGAVFDVDCTGSKWEIVPAQTFVYPPFSGTNVQYTATTFSATGMQSFSGPDPGLGGGTPVPLARVVFELTQPMALNEVSLITVEGAGYIVDGNPTHTQVFNATSSLGCAQSASAYMGLAECATCLGDLDGDNVRDLTDFASYFTGAYGTVIGDALYNPCADLDFDGVVDLTDFGLFAGVYNTTCD